MAGQVGTTCSKANWPQRRRRRRVKGPPGADDGAVDAGGAKGRTTTFNIGDADEEAPRAQRPRRTVAAEEPDEEWMRMWLSDEAWTAPRSCGEGERERERERE